MTFPVIRPTGPSPFDALKHVDGQGREYWQARELQELLGYETWRKFADSVERARIACENSGQDARDHFAGAGKMIRAGKGAERQVLDFHLSRYACHLITMNGDPRKPEIANAQTYFSVMTHTAEQLLAAPAPAPLPASVGMAFLQELAGNTVLAIHEQAAVTEEKVKTELRQEIADALGSRPIQGSQPKEIQRRVEELARLMGGKQTHYSQAWRRFKERFRVAAYRDLLTHQYDDAIHFLDKQIDSYRDTEPLLEGDP